MHVPKMRTWHSLFRCWGWVFSFSVKTWLLGVGIQLQCQDLVVGGGHSSSVWRPGWLLGVGIQLQCKDLAVCWKWEFNFSVKTWLLRVGIQLQCEDLAVGGGYSTMRRLGYCGEQSISVWTSMESSSTVVIFREVREAGTLIDNLLAAISTQLQVSVLDCNVPALGYLMKSTELSAI